MPSSESLGPGCISHARNSESTRTSDHTVKCLGRKLRTDLTPISLAIIHALLTTVWAKVFCSTTEHDSTHGHDIHGTSPKRLAALHIRRLPHLAGGWTL